MAGWTPSGKDAHHDAPLSNLAVKAFASSEGFIANQVFPVVPVMKESDRYYIIDPDSWLRIPFTKRARKTSAREVEYQVSSDNYFAENYSLLTTNAHEDLANADNAIRLRENSALFVTEMLLRDNESRVALTCTSGTNLGSYVTLSGVNQWSDYTNSDPIADVTTARAFIRNNTGIEANTMVIDFDSKQMLRRHPLLLDMFKYTQGGMLEDKELAHVFDVAQVLTASGIKNNAREGATSSLTSIWGKNVIIAHIEPGVSLQTKTFGLTMRWTPAGFPAPVQASRYEHHDKSKHAEVVEVGVFQDEKIVAKNLSYGIFAPVG